MWKSNFEKVIIFAEHDILVLIAQLITNGVQKNQNIALISYYFVSETTAKGQLNSEWICEVIVSPKMTTKNFSDFCPGVLLEGRAEI